MSDLIEERDERTRVRKNKKRKMDSIIGLSAKNDDRHDALKLKIDVEKLSSGSIRLLDEGYFDNGFVIKKGTLEKFLNGQNQYVRGWEYDGEEWKQTEVLNLTNDFVGTVNIGHMDFATFPFIVGEWTKEDLTLVETENDRHGLDVDLRLDEESIFVKELKRKDYNIGVSSEFWYHINEADTEALSEMLGYFMPVFDEVYIFAYGLVGECGNVNSSGLELKGDFDMTKEQLEELKANMEESAEETEDVELSVDDKPVAEEESVNDPDEFPAELAEEPTEDEEEDEAEESEDSEEAEGDEGEEEAEEAESEEASFEDVEAFVNSLQEEIVQLRAENAELKKTNNRLQKKLKIEKEKKESFVSRFKSVAETMGVDEETPKETDKVTDYIYGDGIGE